jgi:hypothetical protein
MTRKVFDPEKMCGVPRRSSDEDGTGHRGEPCRNLKGFGTDHPGIGECKLHGGSRPGQQRHGVKVKAQQALERLGLAVQVDPEEALLEQVWIAVGREQQLRIDYEAAIVASKNVEAVVILELWNEERDRVGKIAKMAIDAGIEERKVRLAERHVDFLQRLLETFADAAGVDDEARTRGFEAVTREIRIALPAGSEN